MKNEFSICYSRPVNGDTGANAAARQTKPFYTEPSELSITKTPGWTTGVSSCTIGDEGYLGGLV